MSMADDIRREKARKMRYKRPMLRNINLDGIQQWIYTTRETCNEWAWVDDNQREALIDALDYRLEGLSAARAHGGRKDTLSS